MLLATRFETRRHLAKLSFSMQAGAVPNRVCGEKFRIGCVSYLNAKPLIYGLEEADNISLTLDVPANLMDGMRENKFDVALLPIIDVQRLKNVRIITSGGIGCDGPTLTVRIFSKLPIDKIETLACDTHSHSSVALARIILADAYGRNPRFVDFDPLHPSDMADAILLIGDKVVCEEPKGFSYQLDLGEAWKKLTGLPFVFAAWVARGDVELHNLPDQLRQAKEQGMQHLNQIIERDAVPRGWPAQLALRYLTDYLKYDIGDRQLQAIRLFHELVAKHGLIEKPVHKLVMI